MLYKEGVWYCPPYKLPIGSNQFEVKEFGSGLWTMEIYDTDNVFEFDFWPRGVRAEGAWEQWKLGRPLNNNKAIKQ